MNCAHVAVHAPVPTPLVVLALVAMVVVVICVGAMVVMTVKDYLHYRKYGW